MSKATTKPTDTRFNPGDRVWHDLRRERGAFENYSANHETAFVKFEGVEDSQRVSCCYLQVAHNQVENTI